MNNSKLKCGLAFLLLTGVPAIFPARAEVRDGIEVEHLGVNNTLVRVKGEGQYLLFPVQESNDDARINVVVDGHIAETINVRLAKTKTDYTVPFDLSPYKGHEVIFDVVIPQGRGSVREAGEDVCWRGMEITDSFDTSNREKYRPAFHHTPLYGWMNDPNGMFHKDGIWHLYYQYNPYGSKWHNMSWGHSVSDNLIDWKHLPVALRPDGLGMIFSGSAVTDTRDTAGFGKDAVVALYTSAATSQIQSMAHSSDDGLTFETFAANPVITLESEARDPKVFFNEKTGLWNLTLAHALDHEMLFFSSPDLKNWTLESSFGKGLGAQDGVWECPDLFELEVEDTGRKKWVLICNLNPGGPFGGSGTQYFVGDFDGKSFTVDTDSEGNVPVKWMDFGKDNYATVTWSGAPDNRRTAIGWMSNWQYAAEVPTMQYRSANTLPRDLSLFRGDDGEIYLASAPSPELSGLRGNRTVDVKNAGVSGKPRIYRLPEANGGVCEINVDIHALKARQVVLTLENPEGEKCVMTYNASDHTFSFDRTKSGLSDFSQDFPAVTVSPTFEKSGELTLRIFVDRSSVEVFGDNGKFAMTNLVFPTVPYSTFSISSDGGKARIGNMKIYSLRGSDTTDNR